MRFEQYMAELNRVKLLTPGEEKSLWLAYKEQGDEAARRRLIESYQPLVFKQALPFRQYQGIMDIVQEGTIGLIEAVEHYDHRRGVAFSLFAVHRIRGRMLDFLRREGSVDAPCLEERRAFADDEGAPWKEQLPDTALPVAEQAEQHELTSRVKQALSRLPDREKAVLEGMYLRSEDAREVAEDLQVTPSPIYRLQKTGIRRVRGMLSHFMHYWQ